MKQDIDIAEIVLKHRKRARLSRIKLALLADVGKTVIYELEHGKQTIGFDTLLKIFYALNIKIHIKGADE
jgi:transcriptional regulator with XRE-family HTH domain